MRDPNLIDDDTLDVIEKEGEKARRSALGEYCPDELFELIAAYRDLKDAYNDLKFRMEGLEK